MQEINHTNLQERCLSESIELLQKTNKRLAKLNVHKEELVKTIIGALQHMHEGVKTYEYSEWKIEVKTPCVYSLDKKLYESGDIKLPNKFNPVKKSISYNVDRRLVEKYMQEAPPEVRDALIELIEKRPGKAGITIKERV